VEEEGASPASRVPARPAARRRFAWPAGPGAGGAGAAGWRPGAGLGVPVPPSSRRWANGRREEWSGKPSARGPALLRRPRPQRQRQVCAPRVGAGWCPRPPARSPASQAANHLHPGGGRRAGWRAGWWPGRPPLEDAGWQQSRRRPVCPSAPRAPPVYTRSASSWASRWTR
jgi:hypothetical protein